MYSWVRRFLQLAQTQHGRTMVSSFKNRIYFHKLKLKIFSTFFKVQRQTPLLSIDDTRMKLFLNCIFTITFPFALFLNVKNSSEFEKKILSQKLKIRCLHLILNQNLMKFSRIILSNNEVLDLWGKVLRRV